LCVKIKIEDIINLNENYLQLLFDFKT